MPKLERKDIKYYYRLIGQLLSFAGAYSRAYKLKGNLESSATVRKVEPTFKEYYGSDFDKLNREIEGSFNDCKKVIGKINAFYYKHDIHIFIDTSGIEILCQVDYEILIRFLLSTKRRDQYRRIVAKYQKKDEFVTLQDIEAEYREYISKKKAKTTAEDIVCITVSYEVWDYYDKCRELLAFAKGYADAVKLRNNLRDRSTCFKVEDVFEDYYNSDIDKLTATIHKRREKCYAVIDELNQIYQKYNICIPVRKKDGSIENKSGVIGEKEMEKIVEELLLNARRRNKWKAIFEKYEYSNQLVPLQYVELEYKPPKKK